MNIPARSCKKAPPADVSVAVRQVSSAAERAQAYSVITYGFVRDPVARWVWPEAALYAHYMPLFVKAFSGRALDQGTADMTACGGAAAFWLPPGISPDEAALTALIAESVPPGRAIEVEDFLEQMAHFHPAEPCWYLPQIATDPPWQGRGLGSALLQHRLRAIDASGEDAYLESSSSRNIALYQRHGFEVLGKIQAGSSPPMVPMLRRARQG